MKGIHPMGMEVMQGSDIAPRELADLLDAVYQVTVEGDRELARIVGVARDSLRALAWNRYAARGNRRTERRMFIRHHKALMAQRVGR
jgi:hypothetical protein